MPRKSRFFSRGFIDILSLVAVFFLVATVITGVTVVNKENANFDLRNKAAGICGTESTGCKYYDCSQKIDCSNGKLVLGFCNSGYPASDPCRVSTSGVTPPSCTASGYSCTSNSQCCSNFCSPNSKRCDVGTAPAAQTAETQTPAQPETVTPAQITSTVPGNTITTSGCDTTARSYLSLISSCMTTPTCDSTTGVWTCPATPANTTQTICNVSYIADVGCALGGCKSTELAQTWRTENCTEKVRCVPSTACATTGSIVAPVCPANPKRCSGTILQTCSGGVWISQNCASGCTNGTCIQPAQTTAVTTSSCTNYLKVDQCNANSNICAWWSCAGCLPKTITANSVACASVSCSSLGYEQCARNTNCTYSSCDKKCYSKNNDSSRIATCRTVCGNIKSQANCEDIFECSWNNCGKCLYFTDRTSETTSCNVNCNNLGLEKCNQYPQQCYPSLATMSCVPVDTIIPSQEQAALSKCSGLSTIEKCNQFNNFFGCAWYSGCNKCAPYGTPVDESFCQTPVVSIPQTQTTLLSSCSIFGACYSNTYTCEKSYGQMDCGTGNLCGTHCSIPISASFSISASPTLKQYGDVCTKDTECQSSVCANSYAGGGKGYNPAAQKHCTPATAAEGAQQIGLTLGPFAAAFGGIAAAPAVGAAITGITATNAVVGGGLATLPAAAYSYGTAVLSTSPTLQTALSVAYLSQGPAAIIGCEIYGTYSEICQYGAMGITSSYFADVIGTEQILQSSAQTVSQNVVNPIINKIANSSLGNQLFGNPQIGPLDNMYNYDEYHLTSQPQLSIDLAPLETRIQTAADLINQGKYTEAIQLLTDSQSAAEVGIRVENKWNPIPYKFSSTSMTNDDFSYLADDLAASGRHSPGDVTLPGAGYMPVDGIFLTDPIPEPLLREEATIALEEYVHELQMLNRQSLGIPYTGRFTNTQTEDEVALYIYNNLGVQLSEPFLSRYNRQILRLPGYNLNNFPSP